LAEFQGIFGHPHHDGGDGTLASIEFAPQITDYKSIGAYRKFSVNNAWNPSMPFTAFTQIPGAALKMDVAAFDRAVVTVGSDFSYMLARYAQAWCTQLGQHAACNRVRQVVERCARGLLQTQDRVGRADFPLTQEFLAVMQGVRRTSVTGVARQLQQKGLIQYRRGMIHVLDRPGLEAASCECYGIITQETDRLLGPAQAEDGPGQGAGCSA
jgi:CRP-like cAMP-binding protein